MSKPILALDFGGTKHTAATLLPGQRAFAGMQRQFSPPEADARYDIETMLKMVRVLLSGTAPVSIGVSFGGPVDFNAGTVLLSHHVPGWENVPLRQILADEFGAPTWVDNDANVAALGEHRYGAGIGCDSLLYVTVSTGVGGGWILGGKPWRGRAGLAGEIGHTVVDPKGPLCLCGKRGCVERLASGPYMAMDVREQLEAHPRRGEILRQLAGNDLEAIDGKMVADAAAAGDDLSAERLEKAAWALGVGIGNAANLLNPERILLGGGVTKSGGSFWQTIRRVARETALPEIDVQILPAALGDEATLWGAVALTGGSM